MAWEQGLSFYVFSKKTGEGRGLSLCCYFNLQHRGDAQCPFFDEVGFFALEQFVGCFAKQRQPAFKVRAFEGAAPVQRLVNHHRVAAVSAGIKQDIFPKIVYYREVFFPVHLCHLRKKVPDHGVGFDLIVKSVDKYGDIAPIANVRLGLS